MAYPVTLTWIALESGIRLICIQARPVNQLSAHVKCENQTYGRLSGSIHDLRLEDRGMPRTYGLQTALSQLQRAFVNIVQVSCVG